MSIVCTLTFLATSSYAHEGNHYDPCPMCRFFSDESLLKRGEDELLKMQRLIDRHLARKTVTKLGDEVVDSSQDMLAKINETLEKVKKVRKKPKTLISDTLDSSKIKFQ